MLQPLCTAFVVHSLDIIFHIISASQEIINVFLFLRNLGAKRAQWLTIKQWVMGLGAIKSAWQRQTLAFGHEKGDKYSCLILDNRGMGRSDKPLLRYTTSEMANDTIEILDHIGWTKERQLHVVGVSMGGMIAQEIAFRIPTRISSLDLISTAARIVNTTTWLQNLRSRINLFIPKALDLSIADAGNRNFTDAWLDAPDDTHLPSLDTPGVLPPTAGASPDGSYGRFETNFVRFAAQEMNKRLNPDTFPRKGFMLQAIAAGYHYKSAAQLKKIADEVGRERILLFHGTRDNMITVHHGHVLIEELQPGTPIIKENVGHVVMLEQTAWFNEALEDMITRSEALTK